MTALKPGIKAPNFSLSTTPDQKVSLSELTRTTCCSGLLSGGLEPGLQ